MIKRERRKRESLKFLLSLFFFFFVGRFTTRKNPPKNSRHTSLSIRVSPSFKEEATRKNKKKQTKTNTKFLISARSRISPLTTKCCLCLVCASYNQPTFSFFLRFIMSSSNKNAEREKKKKNLFSARLHSAPHQNNDAI